MNILISGMTCSGKTTLANRISYEFNTSVLRQDDYFKDRKNIPRDENNFFLFDNPDAFDINTFKVDVYKLLNLGYVYCPIYDVNRNMRTTSKYKVLKKDINVIEGLHTITLLRNDIKALKIYIDTSLDECLKRRVLRDTSKYNMKELEIIRYFYEIMLPQYKKYIEYQKEMADIVVKDDDLENTIKLIRRRL
ncbi:MAG: uridine kinase [Bacilli bacterium]